MSYKVFSIVAAFLNLTFVPAGAQTLTTLYSFTGGSDGTTPDAALIYHAGLFYGTTESGGASNSGTVFSIDPATGAEHVLFSLSAKRGGANPAGTLLYDKGSFYATAVDGGSGDHGTIFDVKARSGSGVTRFSFSGGADGAFPYTALVMSGGLLYGTTSGVHGNLVICQAKPDCGTVFSFDPATGVETVLYTFTGRANGSVPNGLAVNNGILYGTTQGGGTAGRGTIFQFDTSTGAETTLHSFTGGDDGETPAAAPVFQNAILYGTTYRGTITRGDKARCVCGIVYQFDIASGTNMALLAFDNRPNHGRAPVSPVVYRSGEIYGTTIAGGPAGIGTIYKVSSTTGKGRIIYAFSGKDGAGPAGGLIYLKGAYYGTTTGGGASGAGTIFKFIP